MSDSIQVAIKVRPLIKRERDENLQIQWAVVENVIVPTDPEKKRGESGFQFDHIFDPEKTNNDVFETVVKPIVDAAVNGFNGTVFAYGQTSSGKTHTMLGTQSEPGIIPMAVERMFDSIADTVGREFLLRVSYLEIYNEKVNDLLDTTSIDLKLREDSNGLVQVLKCKEEIASNPDTIMAIMKKGDKNRRIGETDMNDRSSRSHTIFRITIESREVNDDSDGAIQVSQLNLVDLAGSERARQTNATGERFKEGTHINMSLSTLGLVIKQLSESSDTTKYINFRDSKLTRLLQASLGGNAMTTIICAVTPAAFEETQCTLWFASRAKSVKNKPQLNEVMSDAALLKRYKKQLSKLNEELEKLKNEKGIADVQEMESKLQEKDRINQLLEERIQLLKNGIISADSASKEESSTKIPRSRRRRTWAGDRGMNPRFSLCTGNLPTIKEISSSPEKPNITDYQTSVQRSNNVRSRKSIIQTVNLNDESFETAFTDFELELIKVAKERDEQSDFSIDSLVDEREFRRSKSKSENRVKFQDDVEIYRLSSGSNWSEISTPDRKSLTQGEKIRESASPGTPKSILRERLNSITEEYNSLREFTTLERQMLSAQQIDFDSPTEKMFMQKQITDLLERLGKYSSYQTELEEQLTVSLNCINELSSRSPEVIELWKTSLFSDEKGEIDTYSELKQLEDILTTLKNEQNNTEKALTPLEKKLTNDYNECLKELEQIRAQKELIFKENTEIKKKLVDESNKLKSTNVLINTLRTDTDCLMEKLIQKNAELAKMKEKVVELERISNEINKSSTNALEDSTRKESGDSVAIKLNSTVDLNQHKDIEISRLKETIEEKILEIMKYRQFEEEIKLENEQLQQSLDALSKVERKSQECQTEEYENFDKKGDAVDCRDSEISRLSQIIDEKTHSIVNYQQLETQMKQKIEELQECLHAVSKVEKNSQECQTENMLESEIQNKLLSNLNEEISKLSEIGKEKDAKIMNYKQLQEQMKEQIEQLQNSNILPKVDHNSVMTQTLYFESDEESNKVPKCLEKDNEISRLEEIIQEKTLEIGKYIQSNEESRIVIERLQLCLGNKNKVERKTEECQTENTSDTEIELYKDKPNEISGLLELIQLKSSEIERFKQSESEMKMKIEYLEQSLESARKVEQISTESQKSTRKVEQVSTECQTEYFVEISEQSENIPEKLHTLEKYQQTEEETENEIENNESLLQTINSEKMIESSSVKNESFSDNKSESIQKEICMVINDQHTEEEMKNDVKTEEPLSSLQVLSDSVKNIELSSVEDESRCHNINLNNEKDLEISRQLEIIEEKILEIEKYQRNEEELKKEIDRLQHTLDAVKNIELTSVESQTDNDEPIENNLVQDKIKIENELSKLSQVLEDKELLIQQYKQAQEEAKQEVERMQILINNIPKIEYVSQESQTEFVFETEEGNKSDVILEKDNEILKLLDIIQAKTLEIENYKQLEEHTKKEIESLQQSLNDAKVQKVSQEIQTEETAAHRDEAAANEMAMSSQIKTYQEELEALKKAAEISREGSATVTAELEASVTSLSNELSTKIKNIEELCSLNAALKNSIEEKTSEIVNLQQTFDIKIQNLEQNINIIVMERNELKEKIDSTCSNNVTKDFEQEVVNLKELIDKLKEENETLRKRVQVLEIESNETNISVKIHENSLSLTTPVKSSLRIAEDNRLDESKQSESMITTKENEALPIDSFIKPADVSVRPKHATPVSKEIKESAIVTDNKSSVNSANKKLELESSSIFANMSYFDNMEVSQSFVQDSTTLLAGLDETKNDSCITENINEANNITESSDSSAVNVTVLRENGIDVSKSEDIQSVPTIDSENELLTMEELEKIKTALEKENERLCYDLQKKIQETDEVQKVIREFKQTLEELQQTVYILTNENMDMSKQLTEARESNNQIVYNFQIEIDALTSRLSAITEEKVALKSELEVMNDQFENMRATSPVITDDEIKRKLFDLQDKIKSLTDENIELSTNLMEKIEELEKVKESKVQLYDHECTYKEKSESLTEKIQLLEKENIELSSELTEQIEECDKLKETVDVLKQQLDAYTIQQSSENLDKNDLEFFKEENTRLTTELIELRAKLTQLNRENANLSANLGLDNSDEHNESVSSSRSKTLNVSSAALETSTSEGAETNSSFSTNKKVKELQEQVEHLTLLNKKLGDLKLTNCNQCAHLRELNESRRQLKLEVKLLNQKLGDLQKKFEQKCADTKILREKANEDLNASLSFIDSTLNGSIYDGLNVTVIEERVQNLRSELEELKENHNKLSNQYKEKCNELEKLQLDNSSSSESSKKELRRSKSDTPRKNSSRIQTLQKVLENLSTDLQEMKKSNANVNSTLNKFMIERNETMQENESLKIFNEELKVEYNNAQEKALQFEEKAKLLEEELATLYKRIEVANVLEKELQARNLDIEVQLESLLKEKNELTNSLQNMEIKFQKELEDCNLRIHNNEKENVELKNVLQKFEDTIKKMSVKSDNFVEEKLKEEIELAKARIMQEMKCLSNLSEDEWKVLSRKSVTDIFVSFLNAILSKEREIVSRLQEEYERSKRRLEEEKQQCIDDERRTNVWAKTVEADLEKLQADFTEQENKNRRLQNEVHRLDDNLKEALHENQQLHSNISNLEADINSLHHELEKKSKTDVDRDSAISAVQEKERIARTKEEEWENRLRLEKNEHKHELEELNERLESYQSINYDLKNTVEGLDLEIEHLKNTVDIKTNDYQAALMKMEELQTELERMEEINQQLRNESSEKNKNIEEITGLLKIKCDLLTEYKTKVETMKPEYESLQAQITERKMFIEKCKEEIQNLKLENKKQLDILQDKLSDEEIKSAGLTKQLAELKNKNSALCTTIEEFKDRCSELERENASLQRKVRNSTSKIRVESEMQELQDENRSLKNHLEGSYNRIKELQESKSQVQRELTDVQGKNALLEQELNTTKTALESLRDKYNNINLQKLREKYELLLREKNTLVLEIEEKRMMIANKDQKLVEYSIEMDTLQKQKEVLEKLVESIKKQKGLLESRVTGLISDNDKFRQEYYNLKEKLEVCSSEKEENYKTIIEEKNRLVVELENCKKEIEDIQNKNKELDEEMDDLVNHIHKQENEIAELQDRLIVGSSNVSIGKLKKLEEENEKLKIDLRVTEVNREKLQSEILRLNTEKEVLHRRNDDLNSRLAELEVKYSSRNSSKSNSPTTQKGRRRTRRSDLYNQNRNLDLDSDSKEVTDTDSPSITPTPPVINTISEECRTCIDLRNRIREMSLDLVSRNNKITTLEVQLQSEHFPYQIKCNELQEKLLEAKTRNSEFKLEIKKLQRALLEDSSRDCKICRHRKLNKRDQAVQAQPESKICMSGMSSGIVEDHLRLEKMEKERNWMKDLCRSRARKIKELEKHISELEGLKTS